MELITTKAFERTYKKLIKKGSISKDDFTKTKNQFEKDHNSPTLHFKKIICKNDKHRHSIRVLNTSYRIIITVQTNIAYMICVCDHDDYDRRNKNC